MWEHPKRDAGGSFSCTRQYCNDQLIGRVEKKTVNICSGRRKNILREKLFTFSVAGVSEEKMSSSTRPCRNRSRKNTKPNPFYTVDRVKNDEVVVTSGNVCVTKEITGVGLNPSRVDHSREPQSTSWTLWIRRSQHNCSLPCRAPSHCDGRDKRDKRIGGLESTG